MEGRRHPSRDFVKKPGLNRKILVCKRFQSADFARPPSPGGAGRQARPADPADRQTRSTGPSNRRATMSRGIKLASGQNFDFSRLANKTIEVSGPLKSLHVSAKGAPDALIGSVVFASAAGSGSSSVSVSSIASSDSKGSFTSVSVWANGDQTSISAKLFSDADLF
jgi:hypothetical protein